MGGRIEICGGLAAGKTTLATLLADFGTRPSYENFSKVPFWKEFYVDPGRFAFETEVGFLLQHYHQIKLAVDEGGWIVCDFSFIQDRAYAEVNLSGSQKDAFLAVYDEVHRELGRPDLLVHLSCSEEEELRRIHARARPEETTVAIDYLTKVNAAVARFVPEWKANERAFLEIDSEAVHFVDNSADKKMIIEKIKQAMSI